jgi:response regulator RpfG family c-di-GMP phosphodiesterase
MRAGVAAGHPATAEAGAEILAEGGTQFDPEVVEAFRQENAALRRVFDVTGQAA